MSYDSFKDSIATEEPNGRRGDCDSEFDSSMDDKNERDVKCGASVAIELRSNFVRAARIPCL